MELPVGDEGDEAAPLGPKEKICPGCESRMHTAIRTCRTCAHSFLRGQQTLWKKVGNFGMLTVVSTTLAKVPDALYGGVPALVIVALFGMVSMWLQGLDTRHVRDASRRNATGKAGVAAVKAGIHAAKSREKTHGATYSTAELLGHNEILAGISAPAVDGDTRYFKKRFNKGGFGTLLTKTALLMLAQKLVLIFASMKFEDYSSAGCDFGLLVLFNIVFGAWNALRPDEELVGDSITRRASRASNIKMKDVDDLAKKGHFATARSIALIFKIHGGKVVKYEGLDGSHLKRDLIGCAKHFSATYDAKVFEELDDVEGKYSKWYDSCWKSSHDEYERCGGTLDGFDCCLIADGERYGKDLFEDPCLLQISHAVDRAHWRLAEGRPWTPSDEPDDKPTSHGGLRLKLWATCSESMDFATWLFYVIFLPKLEAAEKLGGKAVFDALTECWAEVKNGPKKYGLVPDPERWRREIQRRFATEVAPGWRERLSKQREVVVIIHNACALDEEPRVEKRLVARETVSSVPTLPAIAAPRDDGPPTTGVSRASSNFPLMTPRPGSTNEADGALSNMSGVSDAIEAIASASSVQSPPPKKSRGGMPNEVDSWVLEPTGSPPASPTGPGNYVPSPEV